jgi:hypothetical protein
MKDEKGLAVIMGAMGAPKGGSMNELCVPASAVSVDGDEGATAPAEGDAVEFPVAGKVSRVEGDKVYVTIEKASGQDLASKKEEPKSEEDAESEEVEGMKKQAQEEDEDMGY